MAAQTGNAAPVLSDFQGQGAVYDGLMRTLHDGTFVHGAVLALSGAGGRETSLWCVSGVPAGAGWDARGLGHHCARQTD